MTDKLPFTEHSIRRMVKALQSAGKYVIGAKADGTLIVGEAPLDPASFVPVHVHDEQASVWEDKRS